MGLVEWSAVLGNAGEFFGAIAVFATLFYLARQIRHSSAAQDRANQLAQSESVTSSNALFIETWAQLASDRELAEIYQKAFSGQALDEIDTVRYVAFANVYLSWLEVLYTQARVELGFSEVEGREGLLEITGPYVAKLLGNEAGRGWWAGDARSNYSPDFYADVSRAIVSARRAQATEPDLSPRSPD